MNEAFTQYFTIKAMDYLKGDIIDTSYNDGLPRSFDVSYNCMLPLVERLKSSALWEDFLSCKIHNDYSLLLDRIGSYADDISKVFDSVYYKYRNEVLVDIEDTPEYAKLEKIIRSVEAKVPRYNKKSGI